MDVIYGLIPMMLIFGFLVVIVFIWMAKNGHFDDMDGQANRIFMDDEYPDDKSVSQETQQSNNSETEGSKQKENPVDSSQSK